MKLKASIPAAVVLTFLSHAAVSAAVPVSPPAPIGPGTNFVPAGNFESGHDAALSQNPPRVSDHLSFSGDQAQFHPGERIPIKQDISSRIGGYSVCIGGLDRKESFAQDALYVEKAKGAVDPASDYYEYLANQPIVIGGWGPQRASVTAGVFQNKFRFPLCLCR